MRRHPLGIPLWAWSVAVIGAMVVLAGTIALVGMVLAKKPKPEVERVRRGDMTLGEFKIQRPERAEVYVSVRIDDYYNHSYRNTQSTHYSLSLSDGETVLSAWVLKDSPAGAAIYAKCKDAKRHVFVLKLSPVKPDGTPAPLDDRGVLVLDAR